MHYVSIELKPFHLLGREALDHSKRLGLQETEELVSPFFAVDAKIFEVDEEFYKTYFRFTPRGRAEVSLFQLKAGEVEMFEQNGKRCALLGDLSRDRVRELFVLSSLCNLRDRVSDYKSRLASIRVYLKGVFNSAKGLEAVCSEADDVATKVAP